MAGVDPALDELAARLATLRIEADDLGGELRGYASTLEGEPGRLEEVEGRLDLYDRLRRKHGGSVAAVLAHAEECREKRAVLESVEVELERAEAELAEAHRRARPAGRGAHRRARARPPRGSRSACARSWRASLWREPSSRSCSMPREEIGRQRRRAGGAAPGAEPRRAGRAAARGRLGR